MNSRKNIFITLGAALAVSFIVAAVAVWLASYHYNRASFELLNAVCGKVVEQEPETRGIISAALKEYTEENPDDMLPDDVLSGLGYHVSDFASAAYKQNILFAAGGLAAGIFLFLFTFLYRNRTENLRIRALADYLEQVNSGNALILFASGEDDFSKLEDEIYKTVSSLYQTKEQAVRAKNDFAENLSNIAHQIKTPITAMSLSIQRMRLGLDDKAQDQIKKQLSRLNYLEETLLVLSRLDAGTLSLQKEETDVFTLLVLAADNLQELFSNSGTAIDMPEEKEMMIIADMDWTMEAIMNLM